MASVARASPGSVASSVRQKPQAPTAARWRRVAAPRVATAARRGALAARRGAFSGFGGARRRVGGASRRLASRPRRVGGASQRVGGTFASSGGAAATPRPTRRGRDARRRQRAAAAALTRRHAPPNIRKRAAAARRPDVPAVNLQGTDFAITRNRRKKNGPVTSGRRGTVALLRCSQSGFSGPRRVAAPRGAFRDAPRRSRGAPRKAPPVATSGGGEMGGGEGPFKLHPFKLHLQPLPCTLPRRQQPLHDSTLCGDEPVVQCWRSQLSVDALVASCIAFQVLGTLRSDRLLAAWCAASALGRARTASGESAASESLHR